METLIVSTGKRDDLLYERAGLPVTGPATGAGRYLELKRHEEKAQNVKFCLAPFKKIGQAVLSDIVVRAAIAKAIVVARSSHV